MTKYIFVTGGVVSGLGKGITAASLGRLLKQRGFRVAAQKLDPYINVDPGTMSPYQHGEVFVTEDGGETDLDLGHYERFMDENVDRHANLTTGSVYLDVLTKERSGAFLGQTVQVIPHITDAIKAFIRGAGKKSEAEVVITEIGGTVGDIESQPFLEAVRQVQREAGRGNSLLIHVTLVPELEGSGEYKSKPTQHSVRDLRASGLLPDIIVTRSKGSIQEDTIDKIAMFCDVKRDCVIQNMTADSLYKVPLLLEAQGFSEVVCRELGLDPGSCDLEEWTALVHRIDSRPHKVVIALVGKYIRLRDAYLSVAESLHHAGFENGAHVEIRWIDSEEITAENVAERLKGADGIVIPGGFGSRGIPGKIETARYAREQDIPYLGLCLGMQIACIEFARNVLDYPMANSSEFEPEGSHSIIALMPDQMGNIPKGGTMRLGSYPCHIRKGSRMHQAYGEDVIWERHRHRYEFNNAYREEVQNAGLMISGASPDGQLVESIEIPANRFFVGVQYHPEFKSRPNRAHPLFRELVRASLQS
ncbi:MAG: CTP synthase [Anaerovoracaceae bacterium]